MKFNVDCSIGFTKFKLYKFKPTYYQMHNQYQILAYSSSKHDIGGTIIVFE